MSTPNADYAPSKWRKKPVVIDAWQFFDDDSHIDLMLWVGENGGYCEHKPGGYLMIRTLEGDMRADVGDWVIRGVKGEFYPCKPDIFEATYEPAQIDGSGPSPE